jgi:hypothetical protein
VRWRKFVSNRKKKSFFSLFSSLVVKLSRKQHANKSIDVMLLIEREKERKKEKEKERKRKRERQERREGFGFVRRLVCRLASRRRACAAQRP